MIYPLTVLITGEFVRRKNWVISKIDYLLAINVFKGNPITFTDMDSVAKFQGLELDNFHNHFYYCQNPSEINPYHNNKNISRNSYNFWSKLLFKLGKAQFKSKIIMSTC